MQRFFFVGEMCHVFFPHFCSLRSIQPHASEPIPTALGHVSALGGWWRWWGGQSTSANPDRWPELVKPGSVKIQPYLLCSNMEQNGANTYYDFSCRCSSDFLPIYHVFFFFFFEITVFLYWAQSCILMGSKRSWSTKSEAWCWLKGWAPRFSPGLFDVFFLGANLKSKSDVPKHECWNKPFFCDDMVIFLLTGKTQKMITLWG